MTIGVYGGSFDPPHLCHAMACLYALAIGEAQRILVVPCHSHPFGKELAPFEDRMEMCRLTMAPLGRAVEVSAIERRLAAPNYTVDTLRALAEENPRESFRLIVGSDVLKDTPKWKNFDEVRRLAPLLVVPRGDQAASNGGFFLPDVSSTAIREAIRGGGAATGVMAQAALEYARVRRLYWAGYLA